MVKNRFTLLFCFFVIIFLSGPIQDKWSYDAWYLILRNAVMASMLLIAVYSLMIAKYWLKILILLFVLLITVTTISEITQLEAFQVAANASMICYLLIIEAIVLNYLGNKESVDRDTLAAALCGYAIIVVLFASVYALVDTLNPGSFRIPLEVYLGDEVPVISTSSLSMYFSLVTITTLGYGDISPVSHLARVIASFEAFIGQAYLAILIARLVGLHLLSRSKL